MNQNLSNKLNIVQAFTFLVDGIKLALSRECRNYIIVPICINLLLLSSCGYFVYGYVCSLISELFQAMPEFLHFLAYILTALACITIFFVFCYIFSTVATIIASPFYGLLADIVEMKLNGTHGDDMGIVQILRDIPRILKRELKKQLFFLPLALLCLIFSFVPVVNLIAPILWFMLTAWMGCLQYCDYAYDNHKIAFHLMQKDLKNNSLATLSFGAVIALSLSVPVLNLLIPPAAVCVGTKLYVEIQKNKTSSVKQIES